MNLVKPTKCPEIVLKFAKKNLVLKFTFFLLGPLLIVVAIVVVVILTSN